jgi:hypothetical protein
VTLPLPPTPFIRCSLRRFQQLRHSWSAPTATTNLTTQRCTSLFRRAFANTVKLCH